jgi:transposase
MTQKRSYKQYPKEFKEEAVALVTEQGYTVPRAAEALGVAANILYRWKDNAEKQKAGITLSEDERTELKGLRQEVKTLRVEKEILKKASAFFAKEMKYSSALLDVTVDNMRYAL